MNELGVTPLITVPSVNDRLAAHLKSVKQML